MLPVAPFPVLFFQPDLPVLSRGKCLLERELVLVAQAEFCSELEVVMLTEDREGNEAEACEALERAEGNCAGTLLTECYDRSSPGYRLRSARLGLSFLQSLSEEIGEDLSKLVPSCSSFFENRGIGKNFLENLSMSGGGGVGGHIPGRQASDGSEGGKSEFPLLHDFAAEAVLSYQPSHLRLEPGDVIAALEEKSDEDAAREKELKYGRADSLLEKKIVIYRPKQGYNGRGVRLPGGGAEEDVGE